MTYARQYATSRETTRRVADTLDTQHGKVPSDALDHLRYEIDELQESRRRLVLAADAHRGKIERALHEGVQQQLVALAVNSQLARPLLDSDLVAARHLLDEMARDVQQALDEAARLSHLIDAPIVDAGGLALAMRTAAVTAGVPASR